MKFFVLLAIGVAAAKNFTYLATFDGVAATTWGWHGTNDPVMGGQSVSTFKIDTIAKKGVFNGTCAIVPFLRAPGFCNVKSESAHTKHYNDVSQFINGVLMFKVRSSTPEYNGFKIAFSAKDIPRTSRFASPSFKAPFTVTGTDWQVVSVAFNKFSYDWSASTGDCGSNDSFSGRVHKCCTVNTPEVCPTASYLTKITDIEFWAEGSEGDFNLEIEWIGAATTSTTPPVPSVPDAPTATPPATAPTATTSITYLATFDGTAATTWDWRETNDPVMGGTSTGTFEIDSAAKKGVFSGKCAIVPFLKAPGFCNVISETARTKHFNDVSRFVTGNLIFKARSSTPQYQGFKIGFGAKDVPRTSRYGNPSFKAPFSITGNDWQVVHVPFHKFSYDWSPYTGDCGGVDPNSGNKTHKCCTATTPEVCPTSDYLKKITDIEFWAEGSEGVFNLEIEWVAAAGNATVVTTGDSRDTSAATGTTSMSKRIAAVTTSAMLAVWFM